MSGTTGSSITVDWNGRKFMNKHVYIASDGDVTKIYADASQRFNERSAINNKATPSGIKATYKAKYNSGTSTNTVYVMTSSGQQVLESQIKREMKGKADGDHHIHLKYGSGFVFTQSKSTALNNTGGYGFEMELLVSKSGDTVTPVHYEAGGSKCVVGVSQVDVGAQKVTDPSGFDKISARAAGKNADWWDSFDGVGGLFDEPSSPPPASS
jgi:hypothetical protein